MNDALLQKTFADKGCFPHQAEFASSFFAADSPRKHLLVSAPGMGKGFVSALIVNHALSSGQARRVLILTPSALVVQWQEMILRGPSDVPVVIVDRQRFRELEASQPVGAEIWPEKAVIVLSLDFAKQSDVAAALSCSPWGLLVVDEAHLASPGTQRAKVLLDLMESCPRMRVLLLQVGGLLTEGGLEASEEIYRKAKVTVWSHDSLRDRDGKPLLPEVRMTWINYRRKPEEADMLSRLGKQASILPAFANQARCTGGQIGTPGRSRLD